MASLKISRDAYCQLLREDRLPLSPLTNHTMRTISFLEYRRTRSEDIPDVREEEPRGGNPDDVHLKMLLITQSVVRFPHVPQPYHLRSILARWLKPNGLMTHADRGGDWGMLMSYLQRGSAGVEYILSVCDSSGIMFRICRHFFRIG